MNIITDKTNQIIDKTLASCISVEMSQVPYVKVLDDDLFEELENIFNTENDSLMILSNKYGPIFVLEDKYGKHVFSHGTWTFSVDGHKIVKRTSLLPDSNTKRKGSSDKVVTGKILKLTEFDFKNKNFIERSIRGNRFHVILVPETKKNEFLSENCKLRQTVLMALDTHGFIGYY